jgi:hypothetical protein
MGKHTSAETKLQVSKNVQPARIKKTANPSVNSAPQNPKPGTNSKNQYR